MQYIGKKGDSYEVKVGKRDLQFCLIGAKHDLMGSATVYQDGKKVSTINKDSISWFDRSQMKLASKSYMQILFSSENITKWTTFKITVDSGEVILNGYLVGENKNVSDDEEEIIEPDKDPIDDNLGGGNKGGKKGIGSGAIAGIVVAIFAIVLIAIIAVIIKVKHQAKRNEESNEEMTI